MIVNAPAKINLSFEVVGRREDGYHYIKTVMQTVDLCDRLTITRHLIPRSRNLLELTGAMVCPTEDSTISRAHSALQAYVNRKLPCRVHLDKSIPLGAGLGGGSSDAAATLRGLNELYYLGLTLKELIEVGIKVGSDVPFFLVGGKCLVEGVGEKVTPLPPDQGQFCYIIFRPHKRLSSKEAYQEYDDNLGNKSFSDMALEKAPQLKDILHFCKDAVVSGKGPSVWIKRYYYVGWRGDQESEVHCIASGLDNILRYWDGDIFYCRPEPL